MFNTQVPKATVYLSKRNLLTLLSKLDRDGRGETTACTIIKYKQPSPAYQQTMDAVKVIAVHDDEYYGAQDSRQAGDVHPSDEGYALTDILGS